MTDQPSPGNYPPPPPGNYPPPPGNYPPPPPGNYPPPPPGNYPPPPPGNFPPPVPGYGSVAYLPRQAYTPWLSRVIAALIDAVPVFLVLALGFGIMYGTGGRDCETWDDGNGVSCELTPTGVGVLALVVAYAAAFAYSIWNYGYRQGTTGSSIGKSVMKFKVVAEATGQPIGFGMSIVRQLAHLIDSLLFDIGYLFPLWDAKRQTLADKIMSTVCLPTA